MKPIFDNLAEPPGEIIREEMEAKGWTQADLAFILGYSEQTVNKLLNGKSGLSADMAKALAEAFGTSAELWAGLQKEWELRCARDPDQSIKARALMHGFAAYIGFINEYLPVVCPHNTGNHVKTGCLPGSIWAEQAGDLPAVYFKRHILNNFPTFVGFS